MSNYYVCQGSFRSTVHRCAKYCMSHVCHHARQCQFALTPAIRAGYTACTDSADREEYAGQTSHSEPEGCKPAPPPCRNRPVSRDRSPDKPTRRPVGSKRVKGRRPSPVTMRRHITRPAAGRVGRAGARRPIFHRRQRRAPEVRWYRGLIARPHDVNCDARVGVLYALDVRGPRRELAAHAAAYRSGQEQRHGGQEQRLTAEGRTERKGQN